MPIKKLNCIVKALKTFYNAKKVYENFCHWIILSYKFPKFFQRYLNWKKVLARKLVDSSKKNKMWIHFAERSKCRQDFLKSFEMQNHFYQADVARGFIVINVMYGSFGQEYSKNTRKYLRMQIKFQEKIYIISLIYSQRHKNKARKEKHSFLVNIERIFRHSSNGNVKS